MASTTNLKGFLWLGLFPFLSMGCWFSGGLYNASAQILPDNTLGAESSRITNVSDIRELIEGGAIRGSHLFHSFEAFNIGEGQEAYFANPVGIESIFSRVTGNDPSAILGTLGVNGAANLFFLNPNGIIFGENAQLDIRGSFVASTANRLVFDNGVEFSATNPESAPLLTINLTPGLQYGQQQPAAVVNTGNLVVGEGENLTLVGGTVLNSGQLSAPGGTISVAAVPSQSLVQLEPLTWQQLPTTTEDGIEIPARSVAELVVEAGLGNTGIPVDVNPGTVTVSGLVDVSNGEGIGGIVQVLADRVGLFDAGINANGRDGGGTVLIGGNYKGQEIVPNASRTYISSNSVVNADALQNGDGGKVIVWAAETADIHGIFTARGGSVSGNGGLIETSSKQFLNLTSTPDASALNGNGGTWLIDPTNITIANGGGAVGTNMVNVANINAVLNTGTNVTIATNISGSEQGNITQNADALISKTLGGDATLTLQADNNIILNSSISSSLGKLNVILNADRDENEAGVITLNTGTAIKSNGGDIILGGGNDPLTTPARGTTANPIGIIIDSATLNSGNGNITLNGMGGKSGGLETHGIYILHNSRITSENGNINFIGITKSTVFNGDGISIQTDSIVEATESGNITLIGTSGSGGDDNAGIAVGSGSRVSSVNGNIRLIGKSNGTGNYNNGISIFQGGLVRSTGVGSITLQGSGSGTGSNNDGIFMSDSRPGGPMTVGGVVESMGTGNIILEGTSGTGISDNQGIQIDGVDARVSSVDGNITLLGTAGESSGDRNHGVHVANGGLVQSTGSGLIDITGISNAVTNNGFGNEGISVERGRVESTGTGNITLIGTGGTGGDRADGDQGGDQGIVVVSSNARVTSVDGDIFLRGTSRGTGRNHHGIRIVGFSGEATVQTTGAGSIFLEGIVSGSGNNSDGIVLGGTGLSVVEATGVGNINLTANEITIVSPSNKIKGNSLLRLQPLDPTLGITVGGTVADARLNLNNSDLNGLQNGFSQVIIGRDNSSGEITVLPTSFTSPTKIQSPVAGGTITTNGAINTNNNPLTLIADSTITLNNDIITGRGNLEVIGSAIAQTSARLSENGDTSFTSTNGSITLNDVTAERLTVTSADAILGNGILTINGDATFTSKSSNVTLNDVTAETLTVTSAGTILGNGILTINGDASFTSTLANAGNVSVTNTNPTTIGYSIIGGNFLLNSPLSISHAPGEPLQVSGNISVNGGSNNPLINTIGLPSSPIQQNGDLIISQVGTVNLPANTVTGNLTVNSLPEAVLSFNAVLDNPAITLNQANSFGGTLRFRTSKDAISTTGIPGITQSGTQIVDGTATFRADAGNINLTDSANQFGYLRFTGNDVSISANNTTNLLTSTATGNLTLNSGGIISQTGGLTVAGDARFTTTFPNAGNVILTNQNTTVLGNSLIGGNLTLDSGGSISQLLGERLQVVGETTILNPASNPNLETNGSIIPRLNLPNGDVIITEVGTINLEGETFSGNLTVNSLTSALEFIPGSVYDNSAIILTQPTNNFGGTLRFTTDARTTIVESGTPGIIQSGSLGVSGTATFNAENGKITLNDSNNQFGNLAFTGQDISIRDNGTTHLLNSTATGNLNLISDSGITQNGNLIVTGTSDFTTLQPDAPITLTNNNQLTGDIRFTTKGTGNVTLLNTLANTQLAASNVSGDFTLTSGGTITQTEPLNLTGITTFNAGNSDIILNQTNDFSRLGINGGRTVIINDINDIKLSNSSVSGSLNVNAIGDITSQDIFNPSGAIKLTSTNGSIDTTAGTVNTFSFGAGGAITLSAQGNITFDTLDARGVDSGGGNITLTSQGRITSANGVIRSSTSGSGKAGNINIQAESVSFTDGTIVSAFTFGSGEGGDININTSEFVEILNGSLVGTRTTENGDAGNVTIDTQRFIVKNTLNTLTELNQATGINTGTAQGSSGAGGNLTINASESVELIGNQPGIFIPDINQPGSVYFAASTLTGLATTIEGSGNAGNLTINTGKLRIQDRAGISTSTLPNSTGNGGELRLNVSESITLQRNAGLATSTLSSGDGGNLIVDAGQITLTDGSIISADTVINASGDAGDIEITTNELNILNGSRIGAATVNEGSSGDVTIKATNSVNVIGTSANGEVPSGIFTETRGAGDAGDLTLQTQQLQVRDGAQITAATSGGKGGRIQVTADTLEATNRGQLSTTTTATNDAGDIILAINDTITLTGKDSGLFANTMRGSTGNGGSIFSNSRTLTLDNSATIAVNSQGTGEGGNIQLDGSSLSLDNGSTISAETTSNQGGNITFNIDNLLLLRHGSKISTTAGTDQAGGDGGNITINADFIAGIPEEDSDITANAFSGKGGQINITTNRVIGLEFRENLTPLSDITASSEIGVDGEVVIDDLGIDPVQGAVELPTDIESPPLTQGCQPGEDGRGRFVNIERGGIPPSPSDPISSSVGWEDIQPAISEEQQSEEITAPKVIVEAQGWYVNERGEVILYANSPSTSRVFNCQSR